jgi:hypothetical protein
MTPERLFSLCNLLALAGWVLLVVAPRWKWTGRLVLSGAISLALATVYLVLAAVFLVSAEGGFQSLAQVGMLFQQPWILLAGWVHYLAFDLFVGSWEVTDAQKRGVPHLAVVPCLALTFLVGPVGLLAYYGVRWTTGKGTLHGPG